MSPLIDEVQAWAEQDFLERLTADRRQVTSEVFGPNDNYGMASVLKAYAGLPQDRALKAVVPHGVYFNDDVVAPAESGAGLPAVLCYPRSRCSLYERLTSMMAVPSASPFLYAIEMSEPPSRPGSGAVLFPAHSTRLLTIETDYSELVVHAEQLRAQYGRATVCMYWRDVVLGAHAPFVARGFPIVSAGHIHDHSFLFRLLHIMRAHEVVVSNSIGSHMPYALAAGVRYRHLDVEYSRTGDTVALERDQPKLARTREEQVHALFDTFREDVTLPQENVDAIVDEYLGSGDLLTPDALRERIEFCERLDARGAALVRGARGPVVPRAWRRFAARARRGMTRRVRRVVGT